jgi:hypothetical protein
MENNMNDEHQEPFFADPIKQLSKEKDYIFKHNDSAIKVTEENHPNETRTL